MMKRAGIGILSALLLAAPAIAKPSLWTYERIDSGLFQIGVAFGVSENCASIDENRIGGFSYSLGLYNYAKSQGYTHKEVKAFLEDDAEKEKLRARVTQYFLDQGLNPETPNALCDFGNQNIAQETQVGRLLKN